MKILICGRTGAGKTTLARALAPLIGAVHLDGDEMRATWPVEVGYDQANRDRNQRAIADMADIVARSGTPVIISSVCGQQKHRDLYNADVTVYCADIGDQKWPEFAAGDFDVPANAYFVTKAQPPEYWAYRFAQIINPLFNVRKPTALLVGRWHPFHAGHKALAEEALRRHGQIVFGCRDTNDEWPFYKVRDLINAAMREHDGRYEVVPLPNVTAVCYGRDVGYAIEEINLSDAIKNISGTDIRRKIDATPALGQAPQGDGARPGGAVEPGVSPRFYYTPVDIQTC